MDHSKCKYSSAPDDSLTAGQGKLDYWGFWEYPCEKCAREMAERIKDKKDNSLKFFTQKAM